jgi:hypothetical protein
MSQFLRFYNEPSHIRVHNANTGVTSFFQKRELAIQVNNDPLNISFFLRTGSFTGYYRFADVQIPTRINVASLVRQLENWAARGTDFQDSYSYDPETVMQVTASYDKSPLSIDEVRNDVHLYPSVTGALATGLIGAVQSALAEAQHEVVMSGPVGGRIARQSKHYVACPVDKCLVALASGSLLDGDLIGGSNYKAVVAAGAGGPIDGAVGFVGRVGVFDDKYDAVYNADSTGNGVFFQFDYDPLRDDYLAGSAKPNPFAVDLYASLAVGAERSAFVTEYQACKEWVVLRTSYTGSQLDFKVPRSRWNVNRLDVEVDGSLLDIDPTAVQTFVFRWGSAPGMRVMAGVLYTGVVVWAHEFDTLADGLRLGAVSLPLRWELDNRAGAAHGDLIQGGGVVSCDGPYHIPGRGFTFDDHLSLKTLTSQTPVPLMSLRLSSGRNRARVYPTRLVILNVDSAGTAKWELRLNATLTGATYAASSAFSYDNPAGTGALSIAERGAFSEVDTAATGASLGLTLASGYVHDSRVVEVNLEEQFKDSPLLADIAGNTDALTVVATYMQGAVTLAVSLHWTEFD